MIFDPTNLTGFHTDLGLVALLSGLFLAIGLVFSRCLRYRRG